MKTSFGTINDDGFETIIAEAETVRFNDVVITFDDNLFQGYVNGKRVQANHDSLGIIRWLSHMLNNSSY